MDSRKKYKKEKKKERISRITFLILLFAALTFSILDISGFDFKESGFFYNIYCAVIIINFSFSPLKLSYVIEMKKSYKFKLNLFRVICFLEYIPIGILIWKSTGLYSILPSQKIVNIAACIVLMIFAFITYLIFSMEEAKPMLKVEKQDEDFTI